MVMLFILLGIAVCVAGAVVACISFDHGLDLGLGLLVCGIILIVIGAIFGAKQESDDCHARGGSMQQTGRLIPVTTFIYAGKVMIPVTNYVPETECVIP